jgi:ribosomal protein S18 acetylase RimI-like enzyme
MNSQTPPENWFSNITLRQIQQNDLAALEWDGEYSHFRRVYADAYLRAQQGLSVLWIAELPSYGLIAQVFIQLNCRRPELADGCTRAYLYAFRVKPAFQDAGLGTRMVKFVESDLMQRGFKILTLNVAKDNPRALALYKRLGYRVVDHEPGIWSYLDHKGKRRTMVEPALRMEKILRAESILSEIL